MESIAPLGNLSSAGNNDDGQSITNLYEQPKNDLMPEVSDQKKQKSRNHSPKDRHQDQKIASLSQDSAIDLTNARRGSQQLKRSRTIDMFSAKPNVNSSGPSMELTAQRRLTLRMNASTTNLDDELLLESRPNIDKSEINEKNKQKIMRMYERKNKKMLLLYPEDPVKKYWDFYITIILLISCVITPLRIALGEEGVEPLEWTIINVFIDSCFGIDIIIVFCSAFYSSEYVIVEDRCEIARDYVKSWFIIDFISIFPIDSLMKNDNN